MFLLSIVAIDYVSYLIKDHEKKKQEIAETEKKLAALIIMKEWVYSSDEMTSVKMIYNPEQNIWLKVKKLSKIWQDQKTLISLFA